MKAALSRLKYLTILSQNLILGQQAELISETFTTNANKAICFKFYYNAYGPSVGALRIYRLGPNFGISRGNQDLLWELIGQQSPNQNTWSLAKVPVKNITTTSFSMMIKGEVGISKFNRTDLGDIALVKNEIIQLSKT